MAGRAGAAAELGFRYVIQPGDTADRLDYASRTALSLGTGAILDSGGRSAVLVLPEPGSPQSLGASGIAIGPGPGPSAPEVVSVQIRARGRLWRAACVVLGRPGHPLRRRILRARNGARVRRRRRGALPRAAHRLGRSPRCVRRREQHPHARVRVHGARRRPDGTALVRRRRRADPQRQRDRRRGNGRGGLCRPSRAGRARLALRPGQPRGAHRPRARPPRPGHWHTRRRARRRGRGRHRTRRRLPGSRPGRRAVQRAAGPLAGRAARQRDRVRRGCRPGDRVRRIGPASGPLLWRRPVRVRGPVHRQGPARSNAVRGRKRNRACQRRLDGPLLGGRG